jgi:hypothetical protein
VSTKYSIKQYSEKQTNTVRCALVELGEALEAYHDDIVLVGGWVPYLLTEGFFEHCGSEDIDLALKRPLPNKRESFRQIIEQLGYEQQTNNPHQFLVEKENCGKKYKVRLDLLCMGEDISKHLLVQDDLKAAPFPSVGTAFDFNSKLTISDVNNRTTRLNVADLVACLVMKSQTKSERENRDLYDVFVLTYCKGGPTEAASYFKQTLLEKISQKTISEETMKQIKLGVQRFYNTFNYKKMGAYFVSEFSEGRYTTDEVLDNVNGFLTPVLHFLNDFNVSASRTD